MSDPKLTLVREGATYFGDVLSAISAEKKLNQLELAHATQYSQSAISRIEKGSRKLTPAFAERLADVLGGEAETWLRVYSETSVGSDQPVHLYRDMILGGFFEDDMPGTRIRRMRAEDIKRFFQDNNDGQMEFRGAVEDCEISPFTPRNIQATSYDTTIGIEFDEQDIEFKRPITVEKIAVFPPRTRKIVEVREHITLPSWLEADIHPASNIALLGLIVSHGPIIDPGWKGFLRVSVFNPTSSVIEVSTSKPFLTLRFWMQDSP